MFVTLNGFPVTELFSFDDLFVTSERHILDFLHTLTELRDNVVKTLNGTDADARIQVPSPSLARLFSRGFFFLLLSNIVFTGLHWTFEWIDQIL